MGQPQQVVSGASSVGGLSVCSLNLVLLLLILKPSLNRERKKNGVTTHDLKWLVFYTLKLTLPSPLLLIFKP
jgi:hypothetical protein